MTKSEISKILNIPLSTLNEWEKQDSNRNTLYKFLLNSDKDTAMSIVSNKQSHRLFHILNRNIDKKYRYSFEDIKSAFSKESYISATQRNKQVYSSFFKECDVDDLETLVSIFGLSKRVIKKLYTTLPERKLSGVAKVWDRRFRLAKLEEKKIVKQDKIPSALQLILDKREVS